MAVRHVVAKVGELSQGQVKQVEIDDRTVLLTQIDGEYFALQGECPHHGAPLIDGHSCDGRIRCPWHQAVFDLQTGQALQPPALSKLKRYRVEQVGSNVVIYLPDKPAPMSLEVGVSARSSVEDETGQYVTDQKSVEPIKSDKRIVIVGAGAAGFQAASTLRQGGFAGELSLVTREEHLPYDRTELSKGYLSDPDNPTPFLQPGQFYDANKIEVLYGHDVLRIEPEERQITCSRGVRLGYDDLLIATGARARRLGIPGEELQGVMSLRSLDDAWQMRRRLASCDHVVILGGGLVGMEIASSLVQRNIEVDVVDPAESTLAAHLGRPIGDMLKSRAHEAGVRFHLSAQAHHFEGRDGQLSGVVLESGQVLPTSLAVVAVGAELATEVLEGSLRQADGALAVDRNMRHEAGFYAAGDIALFSDPRVRGPVRIEHWRVAQQMGAVAAQSMLGHPKPLREVPFFWTKQNGLSLQVVGFPGSWDRTVVDGSIEQGEFLCYYIEDDCVGRVAGCGRNRDLCQIAEVWSGVDEPIPLKRMRQLLGEMAESAV